MTQTEIAAVKRALRALKKIDEESASTDALFQIGEAESALLKILP